MMDNTSWVVKKDVLQTAARKLDKSVKLTTKDHWFWKMLAWLLWSVTFGKYDRVTFLTSFATTIGPIQAYPKEWSVHSVANTLPHESRHTRQARWFGFGISPWLGLPLFTIAYLLLPVPLGFSYIRFRLELDAERYAVRMKLAAGATHLSVRKRSEAFAKVVASSAYGWAWPQKKCIEAFVAMVNEEIIKRAVKIKK